MKILFLEFDEFKEHFEKTCKWHHFPVYWGGFSISLCSHKDMVSRSHPNKIEVFKSLQMGKFE